MRLTYNKFMIQEKAINNIDSREVALFVDGMEIYPKNLGGSTEKIIPINQRIQ